MSAYSAERILASTEAERAAFYAACADEQRAQATAYRLAARRARLNPYMTPDAREREAVRYETLALHYLDRADEQEAGESA